MTDQPTPDPDAIDSVSQVLTGDEEDVWVDTDQTPALLDDDSPAVTVTAVGDGFTDDTAAWQSAVDSAATEGSDQ